MGDEELLRDSSTIRDSASFDSQLSGGTVPRPRPLFCRGFDPEGPAETPAGADDGATAVQMGGVLASAAPPPAGFLPDALLIVPLEEDGAGDVGVAEDDDSGSEVVVFFQAESSSSSSPNDSPASPGPSTLPGTTHAGTDATNPSPPLSAGAASLSTVSALSSPLSDGTDDMHSCGVSVAGSTPVVGATGVASVDGRESLPHPFAGERGAPTGKNRPPTSPVYQSVSAWLAFQYFATANAGDGRRRVVIFMSSTVADRLAAREPGGSSSCTPLPYPRELTETDRAALCITLVAHDLALNPEEDVRVTLSARASGLTGPFVRLSRLPPVQPCAAGASRHPLPTCRPLPILTTSTDRRQAIPATSPGAEPASTGATAMHPLPPPQLPRGPDPTPRSARASRHPLRLPRQCTMPSRSPPARGLGPFRGSLQDVVACSRKKAQRAAEKAAFPIRGPVAVPRAPQEGHEAASPAIPISTACRIGNTTDGMQEFELWYRTEISLVDADGKDVLQVVKIRVRVEAAVVADAAQGGVLVGTLRVVHVDLGVDGQLAVIDREGRGRVLGYYLDRLSVLVAAVPPPDTCVVVKDVGGRDGPNAVVDGISRIIHGTAESRERTFGATVGIGGEAGAIPSLALQAQQVTNRTDEVSAEMTQPAWKWTGSIRQRERTTDTTTPLGWAVPNAPDPTYVEWTWSLVCWSTGLPYNAAEIFRKEKDVWPQLATELAVPAQMPCVTGLSSRMVIYDESNASWSPQWSSDGREGATGGRCVSPPSLADAAPSATMNAVGRPAHDPAASLAPLLRAGLMVAPFPTPVASSPPVPAGALSPRRQHRPKKVTFVAELAPTLSLHRQTFHKRWWLEDVVNERWPPAPELGVQRFRFRVRVTQTRSSRE